MAERAKTYRPNSEADLFAPPSKEEVAAAEEEILYAPPTAQELADTASGFLGPLYRGIGVGDYRAEVAGALDQPLGALKALVGADEDIDKRRYIESRDRASSEMRSAEADKPVQSALGETLGMSLSALMGGRLAAGAKTGYEALKRGVGSAVAMGAATNPGNTEGEAGGLQVGERLLQNAPAAGLLAVAPTAAGAGISKMMGAAEQRLLDAAADAGAQPLREKTVNAAASELNVPLAPGMSAEDPTVRGLADTLRQSPTFAGRAVQRAYDKTFGALQRSAAAIAKDGLDMSKAQLGDAVKAQMRDIFTKRYEPIKRLYDAAGADFKAIQLEPKVTKAAIEGIQRRFRNNPTVLADGRELAAQYIESIQQAPNLEVIRLIQSSAKELTRTSDPAKRAIGMEVVDALDGLMQRTVTRKAIEATGKDAVGRKLAAMSLNDIKTANREYKKMIEVIQTLGKRGRIKGVQTFGQLMDALSDEASGSQVRAEDIGDFLFNTKDRDLMRFVQNELPGPFEMMRKARIGQILESSKVRVQGGPGEAGLGESIDVTNFIKEMDKLSPEAFQTLFPGMGTKVEALKVLKQAMPAKMGPSGTPQGMMFTDYMRVAKQVPQELADSYVAKSVGQNKVPTPRAGSIASAAGMVGGGLGGGLASAMGGGHREQELVEGYPVSTLRPIPPDLMPQYLFGVQKDSKLTNIEKAKILNLAHKHGLAPAGR